ncbi:ABC transporter substrate-binding protein [Paenibacillus sp. GXUN7292]|uniref:ABC transporter substrate-binding protein n=1 Tax=Paenibacillus sp. GXUN7292 TaxID=3422499 RepID=UPI003D7E715B
MQQAAFCEKGITELIERCWFRLGESRLLRDKQLHSQLLSSPILLVVKNGSGQLHIDFDEYALQQSIVYFAAAGQTIGIEADHEQLELYLFRFDYGMTDNQYEKLEWKDQIAMHTCTQLLPLCEQINACHHHESTAERFHAQSLFHDLLYQMFKCSGSKPLTDTRSALEKTKAYLECNYYEPITIDQLAHMAEVSSKYYVELFKKAYGKSAIEYVTEIRINQAKKLMAQSSAKLREIAHQVGYNDEFYFSRMFKKQVGVSPAFYVQKRKTKIAAYDSAIAGYLLVLDILPFAAPLHPKWTAYYYKRYRSEIPVQLSAYRYNLDWESNLSILAANKPDLIICSEEHLHAEEKQRLESIAPVAALSVQSGNWREQLLWVAEQAGAQQEARRWLEHYEQKLQHARQLLKKKLQKETVLVLSMYKNSCYYCHTRGMRELIYEELQLNEAEHLECCSFNRNVTIEQLALSDPDHILLNICQETETLEHWQTFQSLPQWANLKAVRKNQMYQILSDPWREYSAYACDRMIDDLLKLLYGDTANENRK